MLCRMHQSRSLQSNLLKRDQSLRRYVYHLLREDCRSSIRGPSLALMCLLGMQEDHEDIENELGIEVTKEADDEEEEGSEAGVKPHACAGISAVGWAGAVPMCWFTGLLGGYVSADGMVSVCRCRC